MMLHASNPVILYYTQYDFMWDDIKLYHTLQAFGDKDNESAGATHLVISYNMCTMWWWMRRAISVGFWHTMIQYYIISYYIYIIYWYQYILYIYHILVASMVSIYCDMIHLSYQYMKISQHTSITSIYDITQCACVHARVHACNACGWGRYHTSAISHIT